jgi:hypothetical protein
VSQFICQTESFEDSDSNGKGAPIVLIVVAAVGAEGDSALSSEPSDKPEAVYTFHAGRSMPN